MGSLYDFLDSFSIRYYITFQYDAIFGPKSLSKKKEASEISLMQL